MAWLSFLFSISIVVQNIARNDKIADDFIYTGLFGYSYYT